jgi:hypothetical protein
MKLKKTILILILSVIIFLVVSGLLVFFFNVIKNKNIHTNATLITLENKINEKEKEKILKQRISEVENTNQNLKNHYLNPEEIDTFVTYLENMGNNINTKIAFKNVEVSEKDKTINFKILITGSFSHVVQAIELLENAPYQINISQVFLNKSISANSNKNIELVKQEKINSMTEAENEVIENSEWQADITFGVLSL